MYNDCNFSKLFCKRRPKESLKGISVCPVHIVGDKNPTRKNTASSKKNGSSPRIVAAPARPAYGMSCGEKMFGAGYGGSQMSCAEKMFGGFEFSGCGGVILGGC